MNLSCMRCGAPFADDTSDCRACGLPRADSLPRSIVPVRVRDVAEPVIGEVGTPSTDQPSIGVLDGVISAVAGVLAFGIGVVIYGRFDSIQLWITRGYFGSFDGHSLLVAVVVLSPLLVATTAAALCRIPGTGLGAIVLSDLPLLMFGQFTPAEQWPLLIMFAGFALAEIVLVQTRRTIGTAAAMGLIAGIGAGAYYAVSLSRVNYLAPVLDDTWSWVHLLAFPVLLCVTGGLLGGVLASQRRRQL